MIEFTIFELVWVSHFSLNRHFWFFGPKLSEKEKGYFRIVLSTKLYLKQAILDFGSKFDQKSVSGLKPVKSKHYHRVQHIPGDVTNLLENGTFTFFK